MFDMKKGAPDKAMDSSMRDPQRPEPPRADTARPTGSVGRDAAVIGPSIHIDGDVRGEEDLLIEGEVNGTVQLKNNSLTIGPQGKVRADVYAHTVSVDGYLEGDIYGSERVHIRKSAQIRGNVTSPRVSLEDGAKFKGSVEMDPQAAQAANRSAPTNTPAGAKPPQGPLGAKPETPPAVVKTGAAS